MAKTLKYYTVVLDGIDKSGKDTIAKYIFRLDRRLNILVRGWPSLIVYAKKFNRNCIYQKPYKNALYVHLTVDREDWKIRCEITKEEKINYDDDISLFYEAFNNLISMGYQCRRYNTSDYTAYQIARMIVLEIMKLNEEA